MVSSFLDMTLGLALILLVTGWYAHDTENTNSLWYYLLWSIPGLICFLLGLEKLIRTLSHPRTMKLKKDEIPMNRFEKRIRTAGYICLITATLSMVYLLGCHREASTTPTLDIVVLWLYIAIGCLSCWLLIILRKKDKS